MSVEYAMLLREFSSLGLQTLIRKSGAAWNEVPQVAKDILLACGTDGAETALIALTDPERAKMRKKHLDAQLKGIGFIGKSRAEKLFWESFEEIFVHAGRLILGIVV